MGALSLGSKEELGNGQTFPGVCTPCASALFPSWAQVAPSQLSPALAFTPLTPSSLLTLVMAKISWRTLPTCHGCSPVEPVTSLNSNPSPFPWAIVSLLVLTLKTAQLLSKCGLGCTSWWVTLPVFTMVAFGPYFSFLSLSFLNYNVCLLLL